MTGGGSNSAGILQTLADVFNATVETISTADSAALGSAMIAAHVAGGISYAALARAFCPPTRTILPRAAAVQIYAGQMAAFGEFETSARLH